MRSVYVGHGLQGVLTSSYGVSYALCVVAVLLSGGTACLGQEFLVRVGLYSERVICGQGQTGDEDSMVIEWGLWSGMRQVGR